MVNGLTEVSTGRILKPGDIVEPNRRNGSVDSTGLWKRMAQRRMANNTFVLYKGKGEFYETPKQRKPKQTMGVTANFEALLSDGAKIRDSYRRLPPPIDGGGATSSSGGDGAAAGLALQVPSDGSWPAFRQSQLDAIVPAVVSSLVGDSPLAAEVAKRSLHVVAPAQLPGRPAPRATIAWSPPGASRDEAKALVTLDRVAVRRLLLGLLALRPGGTSQGGS